MSAMIFKVIVTIPKTYRYIITKFMHLKLYLKILLSHYKCAIPSPTFYCIQIKTQLLFESSAQGCDIKTWHMDMEPHSFL